MSLTDIQQIRMDLGDPLKTAIDKDEGDGVTVLFVLTHKHIQDVQVDVQGIVQTIGSDYTINSQEGIVEFTEPPAVGSVVRVQYKYAGFTDADYQNLLDIHGTAGAATVRAIRILLMDAARRFDYSHGQTQMQASQVFDHLKDMLTIHTKSNSNTPVIVDRSHRYYGSRKDRKLDLSRADLGMGSDHASEWRNP
jgi:hypothetical protein